ncbi:MAG: carbonic anhydrase [Flavobacteriales bacterium]|jgi:carbonic anhydrase|nr:carbonic anhydrase [Flavobacteriales bacterium]
MSLYDRVFENNQRWIEKNTASDADFFAHLAQGQEPGILYIGCSDSRVTAEELMGMKPGEVFVHRNLANMVGSNDLNALSVIEYAVGFLHVKHVVVCGHYFCGGVRAAMQAQDLGLLNPWLRSIRDVYRLHRLELDAIRDEGQRYRRLVELNVEEQCINVLKTAVVQKSYLKDRTPQVHGWVFDIGTGRLIDLRIDFEARLRDIQAIYDLGASR